MAKRMKFSVVGLPHYTIWHLYEPSVDDLRHMEEMELERQAREQEERERELAEQKESVQSKTGNTRKVSDMYKGSDEGPAAQPAKDAAAGKDSSNK
jgi:mannan polymerase II complex ANP1 subunit